MTIYGLSNLQQRLVTSAIFIAIINTAIYVSPMPLFRPLFAIIMAVAAAAAVWEYYHIIGPRGFRPLMPLGIGVTAIYIMSVFAASQSPVLRPLPAAILTLAGFVAFLYYFSRGKDPIGNLAVTAFGIVYLTIPLGIIVTIAYYFPPEGSQDSRWWVFYLLCVTKMTDTGAFFTGKSMGKKRIAPILSPKKTVEGALGGLITAIGTSLLLHYIASLIYTPDQFKLSVSQAVWLGAAIGVVSQLGDLAESVLKRDAGVKHSSQLPGLGGVLDIVDSVVFTAPIVYFFLAWTAP